MKAIVIGGVAAGMSAASKLRRVKPDAQIVVYERGGFLSYGACGLPYYVGGFNDDPAKLIARTQAVYKEMRIETHLFHEVTRVDPERKTVTVRNLDTGAVFEDAYDVLMVATGCNSVNPEIPGADSPAVFYLKTMEDGLLLHEILRLRDVTRVAVVGGGYIGLEMAEALLHLGKDVTLIEAGPRLLASFEPEFSELAAQEFPDLDVSLRGAVSIARRLQDPLAELVKIDPKSIGVGQYQHDVNQKALSAALDQVVTSVVNYVGVDLNTASPALLQHIAGLTAATAGNIVAYRNENGPFQNRQDLLNVPRLGPATFTQCAGFLRIKDGTEPLDNTSVHPESYGLAEKIAGHYGLSHDELKDPEKLAILRDKIQMNAAPKLAASLGAGEPTIKDILEELRKPGRDVRSDFPKPLTRRHVLSLSDLQIGSVVRGTVQNVVDFGAFVDFGLKTPGLVHRSQLSRHPFRHPTDVVHAGDIVEAEIISVDAARGRIGLSMKKVKK